MILTNKDIQNILKIAIDAATDAGKYINSQIHNNHHIDFKKGGSTLASQVVTEIDIKSQKIILDSLEESIREYDLAILSEELPDDGSRFEKDYFWCIDPLDGTLPFTKQQEGFAVSIAIVSKKGESILGVVYDPYKNNLYHASINECAFLNHEKWELQKSTYTIGTTETINKKKLETFSLFIDQSFTTHPQFKKCVDKLKSLTKKVGYKDFKIINHGGAVMNALWALENPSAVYFKLPKKEQGGGSIWDFAASSRIILEAGGYVSDIKGRTLALNNKSTFMNKQGIIISSNEKWVELVLRVVGELGIKK